MGEYSLCHCGHELPALRPPPLPCKKKDSEEEEETDSDVLQRDVIEVASTPLFGNFSTMAIFTSGLP